MRGLLRLAGTIGNVCARYSFLTRTSSRSSRQHSKRENSSRLTNPLPAARAHTESSSRQAILSQYWYDHFDGTGGDHDPPPAMAAQIQAFLGSSVPVSLKGECTRIPAERHAIIEKANALASEARRLAALTSLSGNCSFMKVE